MDDVELTTDIIVGFPAKRSAIFRIRTTGGAVGFSSAFTLSIRAKRHPRGVMEDQVPEAIKRERLAASTRCRSESRENTTVCGKSASCTWRTATREATGLLRQVFELQDGILSAAEWSDICAGDVTGVRKNSLIGQLEDKTHD
jgi:tRNA A37 methylthiotransferase MiaB